MATTEIKVPYTPTEKRRFEMSQDPYSHERLRGLLKAYRTLKQEIPFFAGITLYGSLSKGKVLTEKTAPHTDIDVIAFFDEDKYESGIDDFETSNPEFQEHFQEYMKSPLTISNDMNRVRPSNIRHAVDSFMVKRIREIVHGETRLKPIDPEKVRVNVQGIAASTDELSVFWSVANHDLLVDTLMAVTPSPTANLAAHQIVAAPFFYDIGGGLRKYREVFMKKLLSLPPEQGDRYWQTAVGSMKEWERQREIPDSIAHTYPPKLADAINYYQPKRQSIK